MGWRNDRLIRRGEEYQRDIREKIASGARAELMGSIGRGVHLLAKIKARRELQWLLVNVASATLVACDEGMKMFVGTVDSGDIAQLRARERAMVLRYVPDLTERVVQAWKWDRE